MSRVRPAALVLAFAGMALSSGCSLFHGMFHGIEPDCHKPQEYRHAVQVPPLKVPEGLDSPNTQGALVIPTVDLVTPPPGPHDTCLESPPRYKAAPSNKAGSPAG